MITLLVCNQTMAFQTMVLTRSMFRTKKTDIKEKGKAGKCVKKMKSILVDENRAFNMFMIVDYMKRYYETHPFPTTGGITAPEAREGGYLEWLNLSDDERALWIEKFKDMKAEGKSLFTLQNEYYYIYSKRPRPGESRNAPSGSPDFGPRFQPPGVRPMPNLVETIHSQNLPNTWHPVSPQDQAPSSDVGIHTRFPAPSTPGGSSAGGYGGSEDGPPSVFPASSSSTLPLNYNQSKPQVPSFSPQLSPTQQQPYQSSQQYPSPMQSQSSGSYFQKQASVSQPAQSIPLRAPTPDSQTFSSQKLPGVNGQLPVSQSQNQQSFSPAAAQIPSFTNVPPYPPSGMAYQQQFNPQQQFPQPLHQLTSQLTAQTLSQQTQALLTTLQSSQQAFSQIQQQLPMMQPSNQSFATQKGPIATSQKYQAPGYAGHQGTQGGSSASVYGGSEYGPPSVFPASSSSTLPQNNNQSKPQVPSSCQQISPLQQQAYQSSQQYSSPMQSQSSGSYSQKQTSVAQPTQSIPLTPDSQTFPSQTLPGVKGQLPVSQSENQQSLSPAAAQIPSNTNVPRYLPSGMANQQQLNPQQQFPQPLHQSTSQLTAQLLSQLAQALQTRLQSSQQAFSEILQQLLMMQPSNQSFETQQGPNATSQQDLANKQSPVVASTVNDPSRFQQGLQGAQDWMWKNKPEELSHQEC